jgi:hypothetical protein
MRTQLGHACLQTNILVQTTWQQLSSAHDTANKGMSQQGCGPLQSGKHTVCQQLAASKAASEPASDLLGQPASTYNCKANVMTCTASHGAVLLSHLVFADVPGHQAC